MQQQRVSECNTVTQAEAARRLRINRSTIMRYLRQYPELIVERGGAKLVDFDACLRHRDENISIDQDDDDGDPGLAEVKLRRATADAELREMELRERRGALIPAEAAHSEIVGLLAGLFEAIDAEMKPHLREAGVTEVDAAAAAIDALIREKRRDAVAQLGGMGGDGDDRERG